MQVFFWLVPLEECCYLCDRELKEGQAWNGGFGEVRHVELEEIFKWTYQVGGCVYVPIA